tara:strand:- start:390 stop:800 length:411 start_codon:yes stop_codon:yes gene_type:complete
MASSFKPSKSQKAWLLIEAVLKQQARRAPRRFLTPDEIATAANRLVSNDPFYSSVGKMTAGKVRKRCMTWVGPGFTQERKGTTVRRDPMQPYPDGTKGTLSFRWIGGRKAASIPGHPDYGDSYHKKQIKAFRKSLR